MNLERAAMKGELAEAKEAAGKLRLKVEGLCDALRQGLNPVLNAPEDLEMDKLDTLFDDLKMSWAELIVIKGRIGQIERALR